MEEQAGQTITLVPLSQQAITYPVTLDLVAELRAKYADVPKDLAHKESYEFVHKGCAELRGLRSKIESRRKELKAEALEYGRKVDAAAKDLTEQIVQIEEPMATAKKDFDTAEEVRKREAALKEERRIDEINTRIAGIKAAVTAHISSDSATIAQTIQAIAELSPAAWADEFADKAEAAIVEAKDKLGELLAMKEQQELAAIREKEEAEKRAKEEAERREKEEAERAAEKARLEAENARLAEERRKAEEEAEWLRKEQEEKDRAAQEERARLEQRIAEMEAEKVAPVVAKAAVAEQQARPAPAPTTCLSPTTSRSRAAWKPSARAM